MGVMHNFESQDFSELIIKIILKKLKLSKI